MNLKMAFLRHLIPRLIQSQNAPPVALLDSHDQYPWTDFLIPYLSLWVSGSSSFCDLFGFLNGLWRVSDDIRLDAEITRGIYGLLVTSYGHLTFSIGLCILVLKEMELMELSKCI